MKIINLSALNELHTEPAVGSESRLNQSLTWPESLRQGTRIALAMCSAPLAIFCLFLLMSKLIENVLPEPAEKPVIIIDTIFKKPKPDPEKVKDRLVKPDDAVKPPELPSDWTIENTDANLTDPITFSKNEADPINILLNDSDAPIRLVPISPQYPPAALRNGTEGHVDVRFDVTKAGTTENIEIIAYEPSKVFNRAVLKAVSRWRYQPRLVDGEPVGTQGVVERVRFNLDDS